MDKKGPDEPFPSERPPGAPVDPWTAFATTPERPPGLIRRATRAFFRSFVHEYALAIYAGMLLAVGLTWPTLRYPLHTIPEDLGASRQAWQVSWLGHILLSHPQQLWQSNAFYPEPNSFAFGDSLLGYAPAGMLGDGPLDATLRYNILFVLAHALLAIGGYALVRQLGAGRTGAALAAVAIAYAPWRLAQEGHLDIISAGGIPLALAMLARGHGWSLRRGLRARQRKAGWAALGWLVAAWQVTLGFSLGVPFLGVLGLIVLVLLLGTPVLWLRRRSRRRAHQRGLARELPTADPAPEAPPAGNPPLPAQPADRMTLERPPTGSSASIGQPAESRPLESRPLEGQALEGQALEGQPVPGQPTAGQSTPARPVAGQPLPVQPFAGQPASGQPVASTPTAGHPMTGRSAVADPVPGRPVAGQPASDRPVAGHPISDQAVTEQTVSDQAVTEHTVSGQPVAGEPVPGQPTSGQPVASQPASGQPTSGQPVAGQPASGQPTAGQPVANGRSVVSAASGDDARKEAAFPGQSDDLRSSGEPSPSGQPSGAMSPQGQSAPAEAPEAGAVAGSAVRGKSVRRRARNRGAQVGVAAREDDFRPVLGWRLLIIDALGPLILAGIATLIALPYFHLADKTNSTAEIKFFSPPWWSLLIGPAESRIWGTPHAVARSALNWPAEMSLLPGFVLYALALAGLWFSVWRLLPRILLAVALAASVILTLGTNFFGGRWTYLPLFGHLPAALDLRVPGRMMLWVTLLLGILAAGAVADFVRRAEQWSAQRIPAWPAWWLRLATFVPLILVVAEGWNTTAHPVVPAQPASMRTITSPMLVLPTGAVTDGTVMLWSTSRYQKIANGSGGFAAVRQEQMRTAVAAFPDAASIQYLRSIHVTTVLLVRSAVHGTPWERAGDTPVDNLGISREDADDAVVFHLN